VERWRSSQIKLPLQMGIAEQSGMLEVVVSPAHGARGLAREDGAQGVRAIAGKVATLAASRAARMRFWRSARVVVRQASW
jgi:hypothetical protein